MAKIQLKASQEHAEIAQSEDMSQDNVSLILREFPELGKLVKPAQTLATYAEPEWTPPPPQP